VTKLNLPGRSGRRRCKKFWFERAGFALRALQAYGPDEEKPANTVQRTFLVATASQRRRFMPHNLYYVKLHPILEIQPAFGLFLSRASSVSAPFAFFSYTLAESSSHDLSRGCRDRMSTDTVCTIGALQLLYR